MKKILICSLVSGLSLTLSGCFMPKTHSMGASLMSAPLQHRSDAEKKDQQLSVAASGNYSRMSSESDNLKDVKAGGGNASVTYRFGDALSPVFVNAAFGGFGGTVKFDCTGDDCWTSKSSSGSRKYEAWLETREGRKSYNFWNLQERVVAGVDFNIGPYLILGAAGGVQLYQGGGDYDDMRERLDGEGVVNDLDGKAGVYATSSVWMGTHFGRHGEYGLFTSELDILFVKGFLSDENTSSFKFTYVHPSGFFGGYQLGSLTGNTFFLGKEFVF